MLLSEGFAVTPNLFAHIMYEVDLIVDNTFKIAK